MQPLFCLVAKSVGVVVLVKSLDRIAKHITITTMTYKCAVSGEAIPPERVEALQVLGVPESQWTKIEYSQVRKLKAVYAGDDGSNDIVICDNVDGGNLFDNEVAVEVENDI
jgi:hypothetical protein